MNFKHFKFISRILVLVSVVAYQGVGKHEGDNKLSFQFKFSHSVPSLTIPFWKSFKLESVWQWSIHYFWYFGQLNMMDCLIVSSDRSSYSDDVQLYIRSTSRPLFFFGSYNTICCSRVIIICMSKPCIKGLNMQTMITVNLDSNTTISVNLGSNTIFSTAAQPPGNLLKNSDQNI